MKKEKALEILRHKLDIASIEIGTCKAAVSLLKEKNVSDERAAAINKFFRRWINE